jgi:hypothetical protein
MIEESIHCRAPYMYYDHDHEIAGSSQDSFLIYPCVYPLERCSTCNYIVLGNDDIETGCR